MRGFFLHFGLKYRKIKGNLCKNSVREAKYTFLALFLCVYFTHQITFLCSSKDRVKVLSLVDFTLINLDTMLFLSVIFINYSVILIFKSSTSIVNWNAIPVNVIYILKWINYRCRRVLHFILQKISYLSEEAKKTKQL